MTARLVRARKSLGIAVLACAIVGSAHAQDAANNAEVRQARDLYTQGSEHARNGDWERAYVSLKLSLDLVRHWSTAASLGQCEIELGRYVDAATHLDYAAQALAFDAKEHEHIDALLARALAHVARLDLQSNRDGATFLIDDKPVGTSPLTGPVFVSPGEHVATARLEGRPTASHRFVVEAREKRTIALTIPEAAAPIAPARATPEPSAPTADSHRSSAKWIVIGTGAGLTLVAAGAGVVFHQRSVRADSDADVLREQVGPSGCYDPPDEMASKCDTLSQLVDDHHRDGSYATTAWISAGVLGAATVTTWLLWPDSGSEPAVSLSATPQSAGITYKTVW